MKYFLFPILLLAFFATNSFSQISGGPKAGLNITNFYLDTSLEDNLFKAGFHAGAFVNYAVNDNFSIQPEICFSSKGSKWKYEITTPISTTEGKVDYTINYIDIPLLFQYKLETGSYFCGGPQLSFLASVNVVSESTTTGPSIPTITTSSTSGDKDGFNTIDFAFAAGTGYQTESGINFSLRANFGLLDIFPDDGDPKTRNLCFQVSLGYAFGASGGGGRGGHYKKRRR